MKFLLSIGLILSCLFSLAQNDTIAEPNSEKMVVQLSGLVLTGDSLYPVPFASVYRERDHRGTVSTLDGFFTLSAFAGDTITFKSLGFAISRYVVPENIDVSRYSIVQILQSTSFDIDAVEVYPWPSTREKFRDEFLALELPSTEYFRAKQNLDAIAASDGLVYMGEDPESSYNYLLNQQYQQLYMQGGLRSPTLVNPLAFAKLIRAIKNGELKFQ